MSNICRCCESPDRLLLLDSVPGLRESFTSLLQLKPLTVKEHICSKCLKVIEHFRRFTLKCQATDKKIREQFRNVPSKAKSYRVIISDDDDDDKIDVPVVIKKYEPKIEAVDNELEKIAKEIEVNLEAKESTPLKR